MYQTRLPLSSMLGGLFSRGVDSASHSRDKWLVTGMPSPMLYANYIKINCKQNSPWDLMYIGGTHCFKQAMDWCLLVGGGYKLYHFVWEPPIMCVSWKISRSHGCYVDSENIPLKMLFISISKSSSGTSTNPCFPLRRAYCYLLSTALVFHWRGKGDAAK